MTVAQVEHWSDLASAGGIALGFCELTEGSLTEAIADPQDARVQLAGDQARLITVRDVLRIDDHTGHVREARVRRIVDPWGGAAVTVEATLPEADLATRGMIRVVQSGATFYSFGGSLTLTEWITEYVLSNLAEDGLSFLGLGTIDDDGSTRALQFARVTRLALLRELASQFGREFVYRRDGETYYRVDMIAQIGSARPPLPVAEGRNLSALTRVIDDADYGTAYAMAGATPENYAEPATVGECAYKIEAIIGSGPWWIQLRERSGLPSPVAFDGQFYHATAPYHLLLRNGTTRAITGARASDGAVRVDTLTGIVVNEDLGIVRTATGQRMALIAHDARELVTTRVVRDASVPTARPERNYQLNARADDWSGTLPDGFTQGGPDTIIVSRMANDALRPASGLVDGTVSNTFGSVLCKSLPANTTFVRGELLWINGVNRGGLIANVTTSGAGAATLQVSGNFAVTDGQTVEVRRPYNPAPSWAGNNLLVLPMQNLTDLSSGIDLPAITIGPFLDAYKHLRCAVYGEYFGINRSVSTPNTAQIRLRTDTAVGLFGDDANALSAWSPTSNVTFPFDGTGVLANAIAGHTLTESRRVSVRLRPPSLTGTNWSLTYAVYGVSLMLGIGATNPEGVPADFVFGAHPNALVARANQLLAQTAVEPRYVDLTLLDLSSVLGYDVSAESVQLGQTIVAEDVDITARVIGVTWNLTNPTQTTVRLAQRSPELSRLLARL